MTSIITSPRIHNQPGPLRPRAWLTRALVDQVLAGVPVRALYPDGAVRGGGGPDDPALRIVRPVAFFERLGRNPKIGLGEAYTAGDWTVAEGTDLGELLTPFAARLTALLPRPLTRLRGLVDQRVPRGLRNSLSGARANVSAHYDLSNELFARFLDPTMSYSCAVFDGQPPYGAQSLETAQRRKIDRILDLAGVTEGTRLLEIGIGWGALAIAAARRGALVTGVTLSSEQLDLATKWVADAGVGDRVELRLQDYRSVQGEFDAIVSVEMIEAVGEEYWPTYFAALDRLLAPGGTIALQAILMDHDRMLATRNSFSWIQKYIFPGGLIPSRRAIEESLAANTGLRIVADDRFGPHYAETLRRWRRRFEDQWPQLRQFGFDERFRRTWEFYLAYCEAGFAAGYLDVGQLQLARGSR
ncbi:cyclopropane-fatty-acyl-phospholipid synthase family protein [Kribbella sp. NBC_00359]|uniref:cyclopropane-fatty-acyl-phospholipid synthase family protein n=1 Tax=Kribbella sp. NBC_00359 TaxID=2975966 RepID=UPI002E1DF0E4